LGTTRWEAGVVLRQASDVRADVELRGLWTEVQDRHAAGIIFGEIFDRLVSTHRTELFGVGDQALRNREMRLALGTEFFDERFAGIFCGFHCECRKRKEE
jgi:hypothetical protein